MIAAQADAFEAIRRLRHYVFDHLGRLRPTADEVAEHEDQRLTGFVRRVLYYSLFQLGQEVETTVRVADCIVAFWLAL